MYVLNLCIEANHTDSFKQNRDYNTTFTHKHEDLPWKPLTRKTNKPWSQTPYFLIIIMYDSQHNIGIMSLE